MTICRRCFVSGRVQGVFYRATARDRARSLGVSGHARNLDDGRVEVLACGAPEKVEEFIAWLWTGSSASRVDDVEVHEADGESPAGFSTR